MSIHFTAWLRAWRRARHGTQTVAAVPAPVRSAAAPLTESNPPAVYAAGIACAGQVGERSR